MGEEACAGPTVLALYISLLSDELLSAECGKSGGQHDRFTSRGKHWLNWCVTLGGQPRYRLLCMAKHAILGCPSLPGEIFTA